MRAPTIHTVLQRLERVYHPPKTFLRFRTPLDLLVVTILSAQCTDVRVNMVSKELFRKYRRPEDYLRVSQRMLERDIHSCGTYRMKAKAIRASCRTILDRFGGKVPRTMDDMLKLKGVGRKTAAVVLCAAFNKLEGIAVDTHVLRLSQRLGLSREKLQDKVERDLMRIVPRKDWGRITPLMISHGRAVCTARNRQCDRCVFRRACPSSRVMGKPDLAKEL